MQNVRNDHITLSQIKSRPIRKIGNRNFNEIPDFEIPANETDVRITSAVIIIAMCALPLYLYTSSLIVPLFATLLLAKLSWVIVTGEKNRRNNYLRDYVITINRFSDDALLKACDLKDPQTSETLKRFLQYRQVKAENQAT